ncbi:MAG: 50S ribosomal protein L32 [Candidatus Levybacteria bacterium RIFCSPHIGHO2_02_FULL_37_10]|uniref:Large ribosomal subunit protein bL32 n=1 Tax=Candidatus Portnoybacteria bacterium RIFCSPHIGHO2_01_FULL_40_12b TaxID=1801994 RepID=A0A1G2FCW1_9BACT|nr:MAG: 50S ribosomal protein L32 [Candidatus Levybacteria bacterium RIFCSPHIGHO2_02_FULL_37_10]OGZ35697.1 MAG: 50S ribosomal protein L32 [Candidatus Portnoybacteria bacterium RIFCSPHIGHO2_01_FULL_40_12b]
MPHEPKKRHSRARQGKRRSSIRLKIASFVACPNCNNTILPHIICKKCGFYNGRQVLAIKAKEKSPGVSGEKTA